MHSHAFLYYPMDHRSIHLSSTLNAKVSHEAEVGFLSAFSISTRSRLYNLAPVGYTMKHTNITYSFVCRYLLVLKTSQKSENENKCNERQEYSVGRNLTVGVFNNGRANVAFETDVAKLHFLLNSYTILSILQYVTLTFT